MATDAPAHMRRLPWQTVSVESIEPLSRRGKLLHVRSPIGRASPGQHIDLRLTAPDGYQAQRSFSIASAPHEPGLSLAVEHVAEGEVSPYRPHDRGSGRRYFRAARADRRLLRVGGSGRRTAVSVRRRFRHRAVHGRCHRACVAGGLPTALLYARS